MQTKPKSRRFWQLPDAELLRQQPWLQKFGPQLNTPALWRLQRRSLQRACAVGLFCAWLPLPIQMILAAALAIRLQAHLPLALGLVWLNNPLTLPLLILAGYQTGVGVLQIPAQPFVFEASWQWLAASLHQVGVPLFTGSVLLGLLSALLSWPLSARVWYFHLRHRRAKARRIRQSC
jgi:hypothetical protein